MAAKEWPLTQRQDSLQDQLRDLIPLAEQEGMYDAADYLKTILELQSGH